MNRIETLFARCKAENRPACVMFASCGFPTLAESETIIETMIENGADIIELGVPFSDPIADGPVIQAASQQALENGITLSQIIEMGKRIRERHPETGLILFSYFNVILNAGTESLCTLLVEAGIDGILCVDLPYEECAELKPVCDAHGLHLIPLVSPNTDTARIPKITKGHSGFVYAVTVRGITGERKTLPPELGERLENIRRLTGLPVVAGFGIADGETARQIARYAEGFVIGSAGIRPFLKHGFDDGLTALKTLLTAL